MLKKVKSMLCKVKATGGKTAMCAFMLVTMFVPVVGAEGLVEGATRIFSTLYTDISGIITIAAVVVLAIAFFTLIFGRSSRSAETSMAWIKRIVLTWIIFNCLGAGISYAETMFTGLQYQGGGAGGGVQGGGAGL